MIKHASCAVYFDEHGLPTQVACIALDEHKKSVLGARPYILNGGIDSIPLEDVRRSFRFWVEHTFKDLQSDSLAKELDVSWLFYSYEEKRFIDLLLNGIERYSDEDTSFVIRELLGFLNSQQTSKANLYKLKNFWVLTTQLKVKHDYKKKLAIQQVFLLPDLLRELNARISVYVK